MRLSDVVEWQCPDCGQWVPAAWWRHVHMTLPEPTMDEMRAMRTAEEAGLEGIVPDAFAKVTTTIYWRTGKEPSRRDT